MRSLSFDFRGMKSRFDRPQFVPHLPLPHLMGNRLLSVCEYDHLRTPREHQMRTTRLASLPSRLPSRGQPLRVSAVPHCCYRPSVHHDISEGKVRYEKGKAYHGKKVDSSLGIVQLDQERWLVMRCQLLFFGLLFLVWHVVFNFAKVRFKEQTKPLDAYHRVVLVIMIGVRMMLVLMSMCLCSSRH